VVYGLGHTVAYPQLSVWVAQYFAAAERGKPVSLFNGFFNAGIYLTPLIAGAAIGAIGLRGVMLGLVGAGLAVVAYLVALHAGDGARRRADEPRAD
jgi:predicted MFS family arabinose efflux permease